MTSKTIWSGLLGLDLAMTVLTPMDLLATVGGVALGLTARSAWKTRSKSVI